MLLRKQRVEGGGGGLKKEAEYEMRGREGEGQDLGRDPHKTCDDGKSKRRKTKRRKERKKQGEIK